PAPPGPPAPTVTNTPRPPPPPPPPPSPTPSWGVGMVVYFPGVTGQGQLMGRILAIREDRTLNGVAARGKFVTVFWRVTNTGTTVESVSSRIVALGDNQGRRWAASPPEIQRQAKTQFRRNIYFTAIAPGRSDEEVITFDVPADATGFGLVVTP
ncbi:MAG TPA: hypothetical protein VM536_18655, partial [Chloroflexia bacterium]|nr:hypothetical protein [Chloroflexia bacterium]